MLSGSTKCGTNQAALATTVRLWETKIAQHGMEELQRDPGRDTQADTSCRSMVCCAGMQEVKIVVYVWTMDQVQHVVQFSGMWTPRIPTPIRCRQYEKQLSNPSSAQHNLNCRWVLHENHPTTQELYSRYGERKGSVNQPNLRQP